MPPRLPMLLGILAALSSAALAIDHVHDDPPTPPTAGHRPMLGHLHATLGDAVWFQGWVPRTRGSLFGACIGLMLLGILERWLAAMQALSSADSIQRLQDTAVARSHSHDDPAMEKQSSRSGMQNSDPASLSVSKMMRMLFLIPRRNSSTRVASGILYSIQATIRIAFGLVIMTSQLLFILAIVVGAGIGEALFGRITSAHAPAH